MLFNSVTFLQFFAAFLLGYHLVRARLRARNLLIVAASYLFYGWWDWRFLSLLVGSSVADYLLGLKLEATAAPRARRRWLGVSLALNLGLLGCFKYCGFFVDSCATLLGALGLPAHLPSLHLVLPVGISFYTFQSLSYTVDVYRREVRATRDPVQFLAYVAFFPQLVAGPIERATRLLPQFAVPRAITAAMLREGVWLMLWGLFKKVVVADHLAPLVDLVYQHPCHSGPLVVLGTLAFALQIYGDFSGYSDIARGLARVLGFELMENFRLPYLATSLREFWRRWHISLSTWLRDYLYVPLGGNRRGAARTQVNLLVTMALGGLWHGAAWHFLLWGLWHGLGLAVERGWTKRRDAAGPTPVGGRPWAWAGTLAFVLYGWLLFRAGSVEQIVGLTQALGTWAVPAWFGSYALALTAWSAPLIAMQAWQARSGNLLVPLTLPGWARALLQGALLFAVVCFWRKDATPFIYFQF